jgi:hypothetical protein
MILNLLNLYTLIFALFGKVNAMTTRLAVMKANISQQGLNLADLLDHVTTTVMMTPIFNATSESSAYYNVTDPILFILNATEETPAGYMDIYSSTSTVFASSTQSTIHPVTEKEDKDEGSLTGTCFQIMVDCSTLESIDPWSTSQAPTTTTNESIISEEDEIIYDEEDDETIPERLKRQVMSLVDTTANPLSGRTTPQSIGRLLDSLNTILRNLKRNTTIRIPHTTLPISSTSTESSTESTPPTTTEIKRKEFLEEMTTRPESLDDLIRWHTAGLILTTEEDEEETYNDVSSIFFESLNQTNPADDFLLNEDNNQTTTPLAEEEGTTTVFRSCPLVVCPWNDTVGYFNSLTTTTTHLPGENESNGTLPCRGDNPQGCTPFWTSSRDETITSFHSSVHFTSTLPTHTESKLSKLFHVSSFFKKKCDLVILKTNECIYLKSF